MRMLPFDWSVCVVKKLDRPVLAVWFDSNAVKMTTAEHDLTKFSEHACMFIFTILNAVINTVIRYLNSLTGIILSKM